MAESRAEPPRAGPIVALEGPSASGKTTVGRLVASRLGWELLPEAQRFGRRVSIRFRTPRELRAVENRLIEREVARWQEALRRANRGDGVLLDTSPFGPLAYTYGLVRAGLAERHTLREVAERLHDRLADGRLGEPSVILYLDVPAAERHRRAARDRADHPIGLFARHTRVATGERELWLDRWAKLVAVRRLRVRAGESAAEVAERIGRFLAPARPARAARADRAGALALPEATMRAPGQR